MNKPFLLYLQLCWLSGNNFTFVGVALIFSRRVLIRLVMTAWEIISGSVVAKNNPLHIAGNTNLGGETERL